MKLAVRLAVVGGAAVIAMGSAGCAGARAYERGLLAQPRMQMDPEQDAPALTRHVYEYREGSTGGYGSGGGGCGCN